MEAATIPSSVLAYRGKREMQEVSKGTVFPKQVVPDRPTSNTFRTRSLAPNGPLPAIGDYKAAGAFLKGLPNDKAKKHCLTLLENTWLQGLRERRLRDKRAAIREARKMRAGGNHGPGSDVARRTTSYPLTRQARSRRRAVLRRAVEVLCQPGAKGNRARLLKGKELREELEDLEAEHDGEWEDEQGGEED